MPPTCLPSPPRGPRPLVGQAGSGRAVGLGQGALWLALRAPRLRGLTGHIGSNAIKNLIKKSRVAGPPSNTPAPRVLGSLGPGEVPPGPRSNYRPAAAYVYIILLT